MHVPRAEFPSHSTTFQAGKSSQHSLGALPSPSNSKPTQFPPPDVAAGLGQSGHSGTAGSVTTDTREEAAPAQQEAATFFPPDLLLTFGCSHQVPSQPHGGPEQDRAPEFCSDSFIDWVRNQLEYSPRCSPRSRGQPHSVPGGQRGLAPPHPPAALDLGAWKGWVVWPERDHWRRLGAGEGCPGEDRLRVPPSTSEGQAGVLRTEPRPQDPGLGAELRTLRFGPLTVQRCWSVSLGSPSHRELEPGEARPHPDSGALRPGLLSARVGGHLPPVSKAPGRAGQVAPVVCACLRVPQELPSWDSPGLL